MASSASILVFEDDFNELERLEMQEIDSDLLMELLEDALPERAGDDRVDYIIRSLPAEIQSAGHSEANISMEPVDMEDILLVLNGCDQLTYQADDRTSFDWAEMDTRECYMDEIGEMTDYSSYYYQQVESVEQVYEPLW